MGGGGSVIEAIFSLIGLVGALALVIFLVWNHRQFRRDIAKIEAIIERMTKGRP